MIKNKEPMLIFYIDLFLFIRINMSLKKFSRQTFFNKKNLIARNGKKNSHFFLTLNKPDQTAKLRT